MEQYVRRKHDVSHKKKWNMSKKTHLFWFLNPPRSTGGRCKINESRGGTPPHPVDVTAVAKLYTEIKVDLFPS